MEVEKIGKFIRELRKERNMNQEDLAAKVLVTRQAVSSWERGLSLPDSAILLELSEIFDISIKELLLGERNKPKENIIIEDHKEESNKEIFEDVLKEQDENIEEVQGNLEKDFIQKETINEKLKNIQDDEKATRDEEDEKFLKVSNKIREEYSHDINTNESLLIERDELEKIILDLVDKYNFKARMLRKALTTLISTILIILLVFLAYYFITSYNTIHVYKIKGIGNEFFTQNGVMINTKQKSYIRLGKLESYNDKDIDKVELYYYDSKDKKRILYKDSITDILLTDYYGYNEFYEYKDLKYIKNNLYIDIYYENSKKTLKLKITKDFSNNLLFYKKNASSVDKNKNLEEYENYLEIILKTLKEKGKSNEEVLEYEIKENNTRLKFAYLYNNLKIEMNELEVQETIDIILNKEPLITYNETINGEEMFNRKFIFESYNKLSKEEKEIYDKIEYYINNYLLNS